MNCSESALDQEISGFSGIPLPSPAKPCAKSSSSPLSGTGQDRRGPHCPAERSITLAPAPPAQHILISRGISSPLLEAAPAVALPRAALMSAASSLHRRPTGSQRCLGFPGVRPPTGDSASAAEPGEEGAALLDLSPAPTRGLTQPRNCFEQKDPPAPACRGKPGASAEAAPAQTGEML